jgi:uncharacterized protein YndB with AHSA1/START domain
VTTEQRFDVTEQLDAIERNVTIGTGEAGIGPSVVQRISRVYRTDVDDLWDAVTNAARLPRWFAEVDGDLQLGGRYQVKDNAGGTIERCEPPHLFEATWEFGGGVSWVLVTIAAEGAEAARLTLEHRGEIPDEFWTQFGPGATGVGWDAGFAGLSAYIEMGRQIPIEEGGAWFLSEEGKEFSSGSSARWADVSIAAGTPEDAARAGEIATTKFYQGVE